ncbi:MAG: hypothetical protein AAF493_14450 [Pseudomonadota bacterium]
MAFAAAVVCAIAAGVKLSPVADYVTRSSSEFPGAAWTPVATFVWIVLCVIAGTAGYLLVRTLGWWVLWRQAKTAMDSQSPESAGTDWDFPEGEHEDDDPDDSPDERVASGSADRTQSGRVRRRQRKAS